MAALTVNRITGPGDMSAVRAVIVAMTAGPPPLPAGAAASAAGTLVTLDIYQDMVHAFHLSVLPETPPQVAITFLDRLAAWTAALPAQPVDGARSDLSLFSTA